MSLIKILQWLVFLYGLYFLCIATAGLFNKRPCREHKPASRFAIIVPAHNEELVLSKLLSNLAELDYPKELYDVYVIADHCTDGTALVARRYGAIVWERSGGQRGKGRSLRELLAHLKFTGSGEPRYDAMTIVDADNLVALNYLRVMNNHLLEGEKLIQCFIDAKNPNDSWVTAVFSINFWLNNRFILQARHNLGLSSLTAGSGVCIAAEVLKKTGWSTETLTEDLEYAVTALLHGYRASFARETRVFDEKPLTFSATCRQRLRWARGQLNVAIRFIPRLLWKGLVHADLARLEGGVRLMQLPLLALGVLMTSLAPLQPALFRDTSLYFQVSKLCPPLALFFASVPYLMPFAVLALDRLPLKPYRYFCFYPFFYLSWIGLILYAIFTFRKQLWVPTKHTCNLDHRQLPAAFRYNPRLQLKPRRLEIKKV